MAGYRHRRLRRRDRRLAVSAVAAGLVLAVLAGRADAPGSGTGSAAAQVSGGSNAALGQRLAASYGWGAGAEWTCLDELWTRESGWNAYAANPASDARGIPQDINGWADFAPGDVRAQIAWGLAYIRGRYGGPCTAWNHETTDGWY